MPAASRRLQDMDHSVIGLESHSLCRHSCGRHYLHLRFYRESPNIMWPPGQELPGCLEMQTEQCDQLSSQVL
jgi:hypothetical protein